MVFEVFQKILFSLVSFTNTQRFAARILKPKTFLPKVFVPRLAHGAGISIEEASALLENVPSLSSKAWTEYWIQIGNKFETKSQFRAATMSYIMGSFPKEDAEWKTKINRLKRESFRKWCQQVNAPFEEQVIQTPEGRVRYYLCKPPNAKDRAPIAIFLNGLESSAEEFAFPLFEYLNEGIGYATLSVPGSDDYETPMSVESQSLIRFVIDDIEKQPWVNPNQMGMIGFSFGAYWTLIQAKTDSRIKFSLCNGIPLDHTLSLRGGFGLNPVIAYALLCMFRIRHPIQLLPITRNLSSKANVLLNKPSGPVLAMNGDQDSIVDPRDTENLGRAIHHKLLWIKHDDHCGLFHYDRMVSVLVGWVKRCVGELRASELKTQTRK